MRLSFRQQAPPTLRERIMERIPVEQIVARIPVEQIKDRLPIMMKPEPKSRLRRAAPFLGAGAAGAALAYAFDPDRGKGRRAKARDMIAGRVRRTVRATEQKSRYLAGKASGIRHRAAEGIARDNGDSEYVDDVTLADKIRSQALGGRWDAKRVIINVEDGVVALRGEVDTPDDIKRIERVVSEMPGVMGVESLLHIKGSEPVNKMPARKASR